jgi:hypothetical protein
VTLDQDRRADAAAQSELVRDRRVRTGHELVVLDPGRPGRSPNPLHDAVAVHRDAHAHVHDVPDGAVAAHRDDDGRTVRLEAQQRGEVAAEQPACLLGHRLEHDRL